MTDEKMTEKAVSLSEARDLVRECAEAYEAAKDRCEALALGTNGVECHIAEAERSRAWSLLLDAQYQYVRAEGGKP